MPTPRNQSKGQVQAGFTMVELLVVISIIAILAGLLMPAVIGAMRRAHETKTLNLIHQCETAALAYYTLPLDAGRVRGKRPRRLPPLHVGGARRGRPARRDDESRHVQ